MTVGGVETTVTGDVAAGAMGVGLGEKSGPGARQAVSRRSARKMSGRRFEVDISTMIDLRGYYLQFEILAWSSEL
jgi:hypothetical protein